MTPNPPPHTEVYACLRECVWVSPNPPPVSLSLLAIVIILSVGFA